MLMNIFSSFSTENFIFSSSAWINLVIFSSPFMFGYKKHSKHQIIHSKMFNFVMNDFNKVNPMLTSTYLLSSSFVYNAGLNLMDLLPYSFCQNAQFSSFFFMSLIMWFSCIILSFYKYFMNFLSHLTPLECPLGMSFFMVMVEFISLIIRPITLSVRMSANLLAGHLLIHLLTEFSFFLMSKFLLSMGLMMMILLLLTILEMGVAIVQSYIYCTLINMYVSENI